MVNGIPGVTQALVPHWRGDLLLILSGVAYAAYSLIARPVLLRHPALVVTAWSIVWGAAAMVPWRCSSGRGRRRPRLDAAGGRRRRSTWAWS